jgi:hypothetical protein
MTRPFMGTPLAPLAGCTCVTAGRELVVIVIRTPLLAIPLTVTMTLPVLAPVGTVATMDVPLQLPMVVVAVPLKVTELDP